MGLGSRLNIEDRGVFFFALLYLIEGAVNFVILVVYGLGLFHVALVAVLSLTAAFGLFQMRRWSLWPVAGLFFIATTYGASMLSISMSSSEASLYGGDMIATVLWALYLVAMWIATLYVAARRKVLR